MKRTLTASTAVLAMAIAAIPPVHAQDNTAAETPAEEVMPKDGAAAGETATENSDMSAQTPAEEAAPAAGAETETAAVDDGTFFTFEEAGQWRSSELIGQTVTNAAGETVGDINELIVSADGNFEGVIVGVGGFLGIGEKNVGVRFEALEISESQQSGDTLLVVDTTREEFEAAPAFVTEEAQQAAAERQRDLQQIGADPATTGAVDPAVPADEPAAAQ